MIDLEFSKQLHGDPLTSNSSPAATCNTIDSSILDQGRFSNDVKAEAAANSAYFCNNPDCNQLLRSPLDQKSTGIMKLGQVAHIRGNGHRSQRHSCAQGPADRAAYNNAIFLCGHCHDLVDKRGPAAPDSTYTVQDLEEWRDGHCKLVSEALSSKSDIFGLIRRQTVAGQRARYLLAEMDRRRFFFDPPRDEDWRLVVESMKKFRIVLKSIFANAQKFDRIYSPALEIQKAILFFLKDLKLDDQGNSFNEEMTRMKLVIMRRTIAPQIQELARISGTAVPANLYAALIA